LSTTTEETVTAPLPAVREPSMLEQIQGLDETVRRVVAERDDARAAVAQLTEERDAERLRADREAALCMALQTHDLNRGVAMRDLARQLAQAERALREATAPAQSPAGPEAVPAPQRVPDAPQRPMRRRFWRRPPRRH